MFPSLEVCPDLTQSLPSGVEREKRICYNQPHLVTPMRLVFYDMFSTTASPSSPHARAVSLPSQAMEDRNRVSRVSKMSRASNRASGISFKRKSRTPLTIGSPTDFRRVKHSFSYYHHSEQFEPLQLSIHRPGNRLSELLPKFESFQLGDKGQPLKPPPRALSASVDVSHSPVCYQPAHFRLPRKPVGSGSSRYSLGLSTTLEQPVKKQAPVTTTEHPLIPHFSTRTRTVRSATLPEKMTSSSPLSPTPAKLEPNIGYNVPLKIFQISRSTRESKIPPVPRTPPTTNFQARPFRPATAEFSSSSVSFSPLPSEPPRTPSSLPPKSPRPNRVTQWLFTTGSRNSSLPLTPSKLSPHSRGHTRSRTLSGSTLCSSFAGLTGGIKHTPDPSRTSTATTVQNFPPEPLIDKEFGFMGATHRSIPTTLDFV